MSETRCEGAIHIWRALAKPGDTCACGAATWTKPVAKAEGPVAVDEALEK